MKKYTPYIAGALNGVVLVLMAFVYEKFQGTSTSFVRVSGLIQENIGLSEQVHQCSVYCTYVPSIDWQTMTLLGTFFGALALALYKKEFRKSTIPKLWEKRFGASTTKRFIAAFIGGFLIIFGARWAHGCPSGHGLSGMAQLSASSFISLGIFFIVAVIVANIIYKRDM